MGIAEAVFLQVQKLPEDKAKGSFGFCSFSRRAFSTRRTSHWKAPTKFA